PPWDELRTLGLDAEALLDFSVNTNPYGPHPAVLAAVRNAPVDHYPDTSALRVREAIAARLGRRPEEVVVANGAADLIWSVLRVLLSGPQSTLLVVEPTFCEARLAAVSAGARVIPLWTQPGDHFALSFQVLTTQVEHHQAQAVYLCSPNTPTGVSQAVGEVSAWAKAHPDVALLLDQSFLSLSSHHADLEFAMPDNVVCVRSWTKDHAIAGVRLGYGVMRSEWAARIERNRPAWTTSSMAQAAALAALEQESFVLESWLRLLQDRLAMERRLDALGLEVTPSSTLFMLVQVGQATVVRDRMLRDHQILVRDCTSFGLPHHLRLCARSADAVERLCTALDTVLGEVGRP
ncbi:MAG: histidinol-phosphate transaminase, partial [Myxococcota bacterium]